MSVEREQATTTDVAAQAMYSDWFAWPWERENDPEIRESWLASMQVALDVVRPLIVAEEHARLREQIAAIPMDDGEGSVVDRDLGDYRADVLALLEAGQ